MKCSKCGKNIKNNDNFCEYCGTKSNTNNKSQYYLYRVLMCLIILVTMFLNVINYGNLTYYITRSCVFIAFVIMLFIICKSKNKKELISNFIVILFLIIYYFFSYYPYLYLYNYNKVTKGLASKYLNKNFEITSVEKKNIDTESIGCDYIYNISTKINNQNIKFHSGYCTSHMLWTSYKITDDYNSYYVLYYLEEYNKINNENISYELIEEDNSFSTIKLYYSNNDELLEIKMFYNYLKNKNDTFNFNFNIYDKNTNYETSISKKENEFERYILNTQITK